MISKKVQLALEERLQDIVRRVQTGQFENNKALSDFYERSLSFAPNIKKTILARGLMTAENWCAGFRKRHRKRPSFTCPRCSFKWQKGQMQQAKNLNGELIAKKDNAA